MKNALLVFLCIVFAGCATGEKMTRIHEEETKDDVISTLGRPDGFQRSGEYEALHYTNRLISGWSWDRADYNVILKDNKVVAYGPGQVRQNDAGSNVLILVPLK